MKQTALRAQKLGSLIQEAREQNGRSPADIAAVLGLETAVYEQIERGENHLSLPDLEALALVFNVPMGYFWGSEDMPQQKSVDYDSLTCCAIASSASCCASSDCKRGLSQAEIAEQTDLDPDTIAAYETGERPSPFLHLEKYASSWTCPSPTLSRVNTGRCVDTKRDCNCCTSLSSSPRHAAIPGQPDQPQLSGYGQKAQRNGCR
jgi:transcriptional regulator with XRE-family HTH domain